MSVYFQRSTRHGSEICFRTFSHEPELVSLLDGLRLALAEDLVADRDFPPFPRATRDGYAVSAEDVANVPAKLRCIGEIKAGDSEAHSSITVTPGEAVEIMTGAPVPSGANAVVMVEYTEKDSDAVTVQGPSSQARTLCRRLGGAQGRRHGVAWHAR